MNVPLPPFPPQAPRPGTWASRLVQLAIVIVVAAVAAGTFVLSYSGVHAIALQAGVSPSLARYYPGVFDAVLVIACAAAPLPGARWWTRLYAWVVILAVIGLLGAMDAVHAMNVALPRRKVAGAVAVLPWGLLLLAFSLWLMILRHFRDQRSRQAPATPAVEIISGTVRTAGTDAIEAGPGALPVLPALPVAGTGDEAASHQAPEAAPDEAGLHETASPETLAGPEAELTPGLTAEVTGASPEEESPEEESPEAGGPSGVQEAESPVPAQEPLPEPSGEPGQSEAPAEAGPRGTADPDDHEGGDEATEVGGTPYATGPRLRRIRSLPAAPVDDDE